MLKGKNGRSDFGGSARRIVASVALFLFSLHALLLVGFMIDADSWRDGRHDVVICTGAGFQTFVVDKAGTCCSFRYFKECETGFRDWVEVLIPGQSWRKLTSPAPVLSLAPAAAAHKH